jgi:ribosomal protein S12 methylthiotransferase
MAVQEKVSARRLERRVGTTMRVLVDEITGAKGVARSSADAPEIDGVVRLGRAKGLKPGDFADVRITKSDAHDLWGVPC